MKITLTAYPDRRREYVIEVTDLDIVATRFTDAELEVINEHSGTTSIADTILALHVLAVAIERQEAKRQQCVSGLETSISTPSGS